MEKEQCVAGGGASVQVPRNQGEEEEQATADFRVLSLVHSEDEVASNNMETARSWLGVGRWEMDWE